MNITFKQIEQENPYCSGFELDNFFTSLLYVSRSASHKSFGSQPSRKELQIDPWTFFNGAISNYTKKDK